jgi:hypothetical protein
MQWIRLVSVVVVAAACGCRVNDPTPPPATRPGEETLLVIDWRSDRFTTGEAYYRFTWDPLHPEDPCLASEVSGVRAADVLRHVADRACPLRPDKVMTRFVVKSGSIFVPVDTLPEVQRLKRQGRWPADP